ncbi:MAG TPA: hypothetical protein VFW44_20815 [Bryobacteraceae bacterium]|nr:hypothetical protein [Bryobacteraceae bacterium]
MLAILARRISVAGAVMAFGLAGTSWTLQAQSLDRARDLVARVQNDLSRAEDFTRNNEKERVRYENVQHHLSEFDRDLRRDHFDKGKLDTAIDDLKNVVKNNTLEGHDRDALASDLSDLRTLRDVR